MIFEKIAAIIGEKLDVDPRTVNPESNFTDMEADSLYMVEIMLAIEESFNITIDDASNMETVADLVKYVEEKTK